MNDTEQCSKLINKPGIDLEINLKTLEDELKVMDDDWWWPVAMEHETKVPSRLHTIPKKEINETIGQWDI